MIYNIVYTKLYEYWMPCINFIKYVPEYERLVQYLKKNVQQIYLSKHCSMVTY